MLVFVLIGLWHGIGLNFIIMGALFGLSGVVEHYAKYLIKSRSWAVKRPVLGRFLGIGSYAATHLYIALVASLLMPPGWP